MELAFTEYVRSLRPGKPLPSEGFETAWEKLRSVLVSEMKKRSLWYVSPCHLGIYGWTTWQEPEALEELTIDCFRATILCRLTSLQGLLEVQDNVEGIIFRNVRHFLYEIQKRFDPLGFTAFDVLMRATQNLVDRQELYVVDGPLRIRNETVLAFSPDSRVRSPAAELDDWAGQWAGKLLPELVTAQGSRRRSLEERLAVALTDLEGLGVESFRFKDLIDPFKSRIRTGWGAVWHHSQGEVAFEAEEVAGLVRLVRPDSGFEQRQSYQQLLHCMAETLERFEATKKTRAQLRRIWDFLRCQVAESPEDKLPSRRKMADLLEIHRSRLAELLNRLGGLVATCRDGSGGGETR